MLPPQVCLPKASQLAHPRSSVDRTYLEDGLKAFSLGLNGKRPAVFRGMGLRTEGCQVR